MYKQLHKVLESLKVWENLLQSMGYTPANQTTSVMIFFPEGKPNQATLDKLEAELESLTSLDISIEILSGRITLL